MSFLKTMQVKSTGHSKCLWMDRSWGIEKGDMLTIQVTIDGQTYYHTTTAKENCSKYVTLPKFWKVEVGDIIDVKISYANVPKKEYVEPIRIVKESSESVKESEDDEDYDEDEDDDDDEEEED